MSPILKRRFRVYAFAAGIVVAVMAGFEPLKGIEWPIVVIAVLGLLVGIMNIQGDEQMGRYLVSAIGLKVTSEAFKAFLEPDSGAEAIFSNLEVFITAGLIYVAFVRMYEAFRSKFGTYKVWFYISAIILVIAIWILGDNGTQPWVKYASGVLFSLGILVGFNEGPKSPEQAISGVGNRFLIAAVAFQLSSTAIAGIVEKDFSQYEALVTNSKILLENSTIFTTSALLIIAFMAIFWVLDEITD